jgi:hypothetical protein
MRIFGRTKIISLAWQAISLCAHPGACAGELDGCNRRPESNYSLATDSRMSLIAEVGERVDAPHGGQEGRDCTARGP